MGMAAVIYKKGAPDNFVWEEIKVGSPGRGQVRLRSTAVGVNFADTYHRAGINHPMIVGDAQTQLPPRGFAHDLVERFSRAGGRSLRGAGATVGGRRPSFFRLR